MYNVTITFNVNGQIISRNEKDTTLLSDSIDLIKARFNFSPEWQGYTKTAIFKSNTKRPYSRILVDDACMVPPEAIKKSKYMSVSVFGVSGTQLITATDQIVPLTPSGYTDDSIVSPAPTENIYQQIVTLMQRQAVDAVHAETAQGKAEKARDDAEGHAEQTGEDRIATGEDRVATGADRSAVNMALTGFAETTLPGAIQAVEDKADTEIARVGQAGDTQVQAVNAAGAEQIGLATAQADRAEGEADKSTSQASKSQSYAIGGTGTRPGEDTDNSKHYSGISLQAMTDFLAMLGEDIATLTDGKLTPSQIPALSINDVFPVASEAELLTLTAERGDCGIIVSDNVVTDSYILAADDPAQLENWKKLGVSYVANAGHANTADSATDAQKVNGHRVVTFATVAEMENAAKVDGTLYFAPYEEE